MRHGPDPRAGASGADGPGTPPAGSGGVAGTAALLAFPLALLVCAPTTAGAEAPPAWGGGATCDPSVADRVEERYRRWASLLDARSGPPGERARSRADALLGEVLAREEMGSRVYPGRWRDLDRHGRDEVVDALSHFVRTRLTAHVRGPASDVPDLVGVSVRSGTVVLEYRLSAAAGSGAVRLHFAPVEGRGCRIVDVEVGDHALVEEARRRARRAFERHSFEQMIAELGDYDHVVLEDFESMPVGELPPGWGWKSSDDHKNKPYRVAEENGNRYLEATDEGESVILGKEMKWDLETYPYVSFRVRVHAIPEGGDERYDDRVDSAAGIYFTYRRKMLGMIPESVKYVWSSTLEVGAAARRDGIGRPWQVVFGSGRDGLGEWRTYVFDLRQAYSDTFGGTAPSTPIGIGVLSDANSTDSRAYADYDDIRALRKPPPGLSVTSGVKEIVAP